MFFLKRTQLKDLSDEKLISLYKESKDTRYVGELFERYTRVLFLVGMKYLKDEEEARDAVMHLFEKLMRDLLTYEVQAFKYWVHTVARNYCLGVAAGKKREAGKVNAFVEETNSLMELEENAPLFSEGEVSEAILARLPEAIASLGEEQRVCIDLFYLQGFSYVEVADKTGYPLNKVKSYLQNGKRNLKIRLESMLTERP